MSSAAVPPLHGELLARLRAIEPAVVLVPARLIRRVIRADRPTFGLLRTPHDQCYVIAKSRLLTHVDAAELGENADALPERVVLLNAGPRWRSPHGSVEQALPHYLRLVYHARIHMALEDAEGRPRFTEVEARQRRAAIGFAAFEEIRAVLQQERLLLPPADDATVYVEFAATYNELRSFAPHLLPIWFPSLHDTKRIEQMLAADLGEPGASATGVSHALSMDAKGVASSERHATPFEDSGRATRSVAAEPGALATGVLQERAARAAARGNLVRAASLFVRMGPDSIGLRLAEDALRRLVGRLQRALGLNDAEASFWQSCLTGLLPRLGGGLLSGEVRLLFDLQRICVDRERELYSADLAGWLRSFGRRPIKRALPLEREALLLKHLRSARRRWRKIEADPATHRRFDDALAAILKRRSAALRQQLRPLLAGTLDDVGLTPRNVPERIARDKLVEELLDRLIDRGLLTFGNLRDAVSRNALKLPDLAGPWEFLRGDPLLRADKLLAVRLDGVYRPGEFYLRGFQRMSALFFGTAIGRLLTLWLLLPFGGAFIALSGLAHLGLEKLLHALGVQHAHELIAGPVNIALLGLFFVGLLHSRTFRRGAKRAFAAVGRGLRSAFIELPVRIARSPFVQALWRSPPVRIFCKHWLLPLLGAGLAALILWLFDLTPEVLLAAPGTVFVVLLVFFSTRPGRATLERALDGLLYLGHAIQTGLLPGLFRFVVWLFRTLLDAVERLLYTVDEWLRFREGESRLVFAAKVALGFVWFLVTYVIRFCLVLLVEPQVNPIKHFPVVTVSHKLLIPTIPHLASLFANTMDAARAYTVATGVVTGIPGIFGFLAWELKENWRLYRANQSMELKPVVVGSHGENVIHLLRPGFHSGTLRKIYAKLRKAKLERHLAALHHVEEEVKHLIKRDFLALLRASRAWGGVSIDVEAVHAGVKAIRIALAAPRWRDDRVEIVFSEQARWLVAEVVKVGFLSKLSADQRSAFRTALAGLYKFAGVMVVREQLAAVLPQDRYALPLVEEGVLVWPRDGAPATAVYVWSDDEVIAPGTTEGEFTSPLPALRAQQLWYAATPLRWDHWRSAWERDKAGKGAAMSSVEVMPRPADPRP
jgi:hypothetical protein